MSDVAGMPYDAVASALIFSDRPAGLTGATACAMAAGLRVSGASPLVDAMARLDEQSVVDVVIVDMAEDGGATSDALLTRIDRDVAAGRYAAVIVVTRKLIDAAHARTSHRDIALLSAPSDVELVAAMKRAMTEDRRPVFAEDDSSDPVRLRQLSEEVNRIARTLAALSGREARAEAAREIVMTDMASAGRTITTAAIRGLIRARRMRDQYFDPLLFADPAWDMLLDLMAARMEDRQVAVSSLCIAAAVPPTTALRWIKSLTDEGLFVRIADPHDGRRVFIALSDQAADGMTAYFRALNRAGLATAT